MTPVPLSDCNIAVTLPPDNQQKRSPSFRRGFFVDKKKLFVYDEAIIMFLIYQIREVFYEAFVIIDNVTIDVICGLCGMEVL
jgi:hypothetical protein